MSDTSKQPDVWMELRKPFPKGTVGILPKPYKKDSPKGKCDVCGGWHGLPAAHLDYVGHANVTDRLNTVVGPESWTWTPMATDEHGLPLLDREGNLWINLTIQGATKPGVGDGSSMKERIGDAIRNASMRFGVALDLWTKDELESQLGQPDLKNEKPAYTVMSTNWEGSSYPAQPKTYPSTIGASQVADLMALAKKLGATTKEEASALLNEHTKLTDWTSLPADRYAAVRQSLDALVRDVQGLD